MRYTLSLSVAICMAGTAFAQSDSVDDFFAASERLVPKHGGFCAEFEMQDTGSHVPLTIVIGIDYASGSWFFLSTVHRDHTLSGVDESGELYSGDYTGIGLAGRPGRNADAEMVSSLRDLYPSIWLRILLKHRDLVTSADRVDGGFDVRVVYPNDALAQVSPSVRSAVASSDITYNFEASGRVTGMSSNRHASSKRSYVYPPDAPPGPLAVPETGFGNWKLTNIDYNLSAADFEKDAVVARARQHVQRNKQVAEEREAAAAEKGISQPRSLSSGPVVETIAVESSKTWRLALTIVGGLIVGAGLLIIHRRRMSA